VFVGRDAIDWLGEHLGLSERETQCQLLLQEMCDLELIVPWQSEKKDKKGGVRFEDNDRFFWFDYAAIIRLKGGATESARPQQPTPPSEGDREMLKVTKITNTLCFGLIVSWCEGSFWRAPGASCKGRYSGERGCRCCCGRNQLERTVAHAAGHRPQLVLLAFSSHKGKQKVFLFCFCFCCVELVVVRVLRRVWRTSRSSRCLTRRRGVAGFSGFRCRLTRPSCCATCRTTASSSRRTASGVRHFTFTCVFFLSFSRRKRRPLAEDQAMAREDVWGSEDASRELFFLFSEQLLFSARLGHSQNVVARQDGHLALVAVAADDAGRQPANIAPERQVTAKGRERICF
jgi:hypothetical protein